MKMELSEKLYYAAIPGIEIQEMVVDFDIKENTVMLEFFIPSKMFMFTNYFMTFWT